MPPDETPQVFAPQQGWISFDLKPSAPGLLMKEYDPITDRMIELHAYSTHEILAVFDAWSREKRVILAEWAPKLFDELRAKEASHV